MAGPTTVYWTADKIASDTWRRDSVYVCFLYRKKLFNHTPAASNRDKQ